MRLVVISHKESWADPGSPSGYSTMGGFPFQMKALSELFDQTALLLPVFDTPLPPGTYPVVGKNLFVKPLDGPPGADWRRKMALLSWMPRNLPTMWRDIREADAIHAPVPGDIGTIGILIAMTQRKRLFVRHCGTWGYKGTIANRFLMWLLERIAGGRNVVMATGGADSPPSRANPAINWIFSTTLPEQTLLSIPVHRPWKFGEIFKLVTVARLYPNKNVEAIIRALPLIKQHYSSITLDIVGDGPCLQELKTLAEDLYLTDIITFHGNVAHEVVLKILTNSDLFVFPTRVPEGSPKVVLEALACGLPVVATAVSIVTHLIGNRNGILLHDTGYRSVAEAIINLISDDKRLAQMSVSAQQTGREYTLERWQQVIGERLRASWGPLKEEDKVKAQAEV